MFISRVQLLTFHTKKKKSNVESIQNCIQFHKTINFQVNVLKLLRNLNNIFYYIYSKHFKNCFTKIWFIDVFT